MAAENKVLELPIRELAVTESFYLRCKLMGYQCLAEIISTPPQVLVKKEDFTYSWLNELVKLLTSQNLLHKLQAIPGSDSY